MRSGITQTVTGFPPGAAHRGFAASLVRFISMEYQLVFSGHVLQLGEIHVFL